MGTGAPNTAMISRSRSVPTAAAMSHQAHDVGEQHRHLLVLRRLTRHRSSRGTALVTELGALPQTSAARPARHVHRQPRKTDPGIRPPRPPTGQGVPQQTYGVIDPGAKRCDRSPALPRVCQPTSGPDESTWCTRSGWCRVALMALPSGQTASGSCYARCNLR